jgi:hypothetical protein
LEKPQAGADLDAKRSKGGTDCLQWSAGMKLGRSALQVEIRFQILVLRRAKLHGTGGSEFAQNRIGSSPQHGAPRRNVAKNDYIQVRNNVETTPKPTETDKPI